MTDYPYLYARVSARRAKLIDADGYENLLKMQPSEIARKLEEGEYGPEIDELGVRHDGVTLVELALDRNLARDLNKLAEMAPQSLAPVIRTYLRRYDLRSLKRLLRWKRSDRGMRIEDLLHPAGELDQEEIEQLAEKTYEEIIESISFAESLVDYQEYIEEAENLDDVERALDRAYFDELDMIASEVKSQQFARFIRREIEHQDIRTALRLKKYGAEADEIASYTVSDGRGKLLNQIVEAETLEDALRIVRTEKEIEAEGLEEVEHQLKVKRLEEALRMLHTEPLGATSILGYVVAKIVEVENLRMLIRAKETGIQNLDTIRRNLVTA